MRLFRSQGYDGTTMRAIATEAGVSTGNAYYYFGSKEHLIQAFYDQMQEAHGAAVAGAFSDPAFGPRLSAVLHAWVDVAADYHEFAGTFFKNAAEPTSPLSPFSPESAAAREMSIDLFRRAVDGSDLKVAKGLRGELPELLWLLQMGIVLFWVYDASPAQRRTRLLIDSVVPIIDKLTRLTRLPVVRGVVDDLVGLIGQLRSRDK